MRPTREEFNRDLLYMTNDELKELSDSIYKDFVGIFDLQKGRIVKTRKARTAMNDFRSLFVELRRRYPTT